MAQLSEAAADQLDPAQAADLARVIDLEARWENLRVAPPAPGHGTRDLQDRQRAYEAYQARWSAYTARYRTLRVPELTPNGPDRLAAWCRTVGAVLRRAGPEAGCPAHAVEKARRLARRVAERVGREPADAGAVPINHADAVRALDELARWCAGPTAGGLGNVAVELPRSA